MLVSVYFLILSLLIPSLSLSMDLPEDESFVSYNKFRHGQFVRALLEAAQEDGMLTDSIDSILEKLENTRCKKTIIKTVNSKPIGIVSYLYGDPTICGFNLKWLFGRQGHIQLLAVDPNHRTKEPIKQLLNIAIDELKPKVHKITLRTTNIEAEKLYTYIGFQLMCAHPKLREYMMRGHQ